MNLFYTGFAAFLESTISASVVVLLVMVIQRVFRKSLSARVRHLLWLIVIIRLMVPVFPESSLSVVQLVDYGRTLHEKWWSAGAHPSSEPMPISNQTFQTLQNSDTAVESSPPLSAKEDGEIGSAGRSVTDPETFSPVLKIGAFFWVAGMSMMLIHVWLFLRRMSRLRKRLLPVTDPDVLVVLDECRRSFKITSTIPLYTGVSATSPFLSGLLRPWIFVPITVIREMDNTQLYHVLAHELAHYKRKDMLWNLLGGLAAAIHWLNPLIWLGMRHMKSDRELACDAYVLEKMGEEEAAAYGMTMISFLKRFSITGERGSLLYFSKPRGREDVIRRITMITLFKKGSYRISAGAVILIAALSTVSLTNASGSPLPPAGIHESVKVAANEDILKPKGLRLYNSLDRAVKKAGFAFEAPSALPPGFQFKEVWLSGEVTSNGSERIDRVSLTFDRGGKKYKNTSFRLATSNLKYTKSQVEEIKSLKESLLKSKASLEEKDIDVEGLSLHEINAAYGTVQSTYSYYLWERDGIGYMLDFESSGLSERELVSLIASLKLPDEKMKKSYINIDSLTVDIIDKEDLELAVSAIGFTPKLPLNVSGFTMDSTFVTSKISFSHPRSDKEALTRVLFSMYINPESSDKNNPQRVMLYQMKDDGQYATFKSNKQVVFFGIDGKGVKAPAELIKVGGKEVLRTPPYKTDGKLSTSRDPEFISYFWLDKGIVYKAVFKKDQVKDQQAIVAALLKAQPTKLLG